MRPLKRCLFAVYFAASAGALITGLQYLYSGEWPALATIALWAAVAMLTQNQLPRPWFAILQGADRELRALALVAFAVGLLTIGRGPLLWWNLAGLAMLLLLLRWRWKQAV